jgi:hypothetical protein
MNKEITKESLKALYEEKKAYGVPLFSILVAFFLVIFFILPQVLSLPGKLSERTAEMEKLTNLNDKEKVLTSTNEQTLDANLRLATKALPGEKDFESIISALSLAASNSNVVLSDYAFQSVEAVDDEERFPTLSFEVSVIGEARSIISFTNELYNISPIAEVDAITIGEASSKVLVNFYYKPFPQLTNEDILNISELSERERETLSTISNWAQSESSLELVAPPSTESGERSSPFD